MNTMKTILVPTDYSDTAKNAANYAARLAQEMNARLLLLHVYHVPLPVSEVPIAVVTPEELEAEHERLLKDEAKRIQQLSGLELAWKSRIGLAADEIIREEKEAALIVMGMHGAGKLTEVLIGSVATSTMRKANIPVLLIPEDARFSIPKKIVLACDFEPRTDMNSLKTLSSFSKIFASSIVVLNVKQQQEGVSVDEAMSEIKMEDELHGIQHVYRFSEHNDPVSGIKRFVEEQGAEMVAVIPHRYSFIERIFHHSISKELAFHSKVPVLALPDLHVSAPIYFL